MISGFAKGGKNGKELKKSRPTRRDHLSFSIVLIRPRSRRHFAGSCCDPASLGRWLLAGTARSFELKVDRCDPEKRPARV